MEPDGAVRAMVGGLDYDDSQFNRATHAHRQPGSSFKLYVYATGFENGYEPALDRCATTAGPCGNWSPKNYSGGGSSGRSLAAIDAFRMSLNVPAVNVSLQVGPREGGGDDPAPRRGRREEDVLDGAGRHRHHAAAAHRRLCPLRQRRQAARPYAILEMFNSKGELIYARTRRSRGPGQVVSRKVAEDMNQMMLAVVTNGTAQNARRWTSPRPSARPAPARATATPGSSASPAPW